MWGCLATLVSALVWSGGLMALSECAATRAWWLNQLRKSVRSLWVLETKVKIGFHTPCLLMCETRVSAEKVHDQDVIWKSPPKSKNKPCRFKPWIEILGQISVKRKPDCTGFLSWANHSCAPRGLIITNNMEPLGEGWQGKWCAPPVCPHKWLWPVLALIPHNPGMLQDMTSAVCPRV